MNSTHFAAISSGITHVISEGIARLKHVRLETNSDRCLIDIRGKGSMELVWDRNNNVLKENGITDLKSMQKNLRYSAVQLYQYMLYLYNEQKQLDITIDIRDYFELRTINRRRENMVRFYQDLAILSCISIDYEEKILGRSKRMIGKVISINGYLSSSGDEFSSRETGRKVAKVSVDLDKWVKSLKLTQFILLPKAFFQYNTPNESSAIILSLKFNLLCRINLRKGPDACKVKVRSLLRALGVTESDFKKQGIMYYKVILVRAFKLLECEGYSITYENGAFESGRVLDSIMYYQNDCLKPNYASITLKKSRKASAKKQKNTMQ